jgi:hypothetical protein
MYNNDNIDIHHIFPRAYCRNKGIPAYLYNSIVNKSPLSAMTNRSIGGNAPSAYLQFLEKEKDISGEALDEILKSHLIDVESIRSDDFETFFEKRKEALYKKILAAMGQYNYNF